MTMVLKEDGHQVGCLDNTLLPSPAEMKLGTSGLCGSCQAPFVVAYRNTPSGMVWVPAKPPERPVQGALEIGQVVNEATVTYTIVLPGCPPSKNQFNSLPPAWKNSQKKAWKRRVKAACEAQNIPKGNPMVGLAARIVFATEANRRDPQNYAQQLWDWVPDALVEGGYLVDDNEGRVQIGANWGLEMAVDKRKGPKKARERTIITIALKRAVLRRAK
jgi:hypothetical protein